MSESLGPALPKARRWIRMRVRCRATPRVAVVRSVVVSVEALVQHPLYKKRVRRSKRFMVHDEQNEARVGDTVRIIETRPLSARKRWRLANVVSRAE
jgi:small subunit ribosomal protein S17